MEWVELLAVSLSGTGNIFKHLLIIWSKYLAIHARRSSLGITALLVQLKLTIATLTSLFTKA